MRRFWPLLFFIIIIIISLINHDDNNETDTNHPASSERIISLSPSITETLWALGVSDRLVAVSDYCDFPDSINDLPKIGGYLDPNLEGILSLQPDLVIVLAKQTRLIEQLAQLHIDTLAIRNDELKDIADTISLIGERVGHREQAMKLNNKLEQQILFIQERIKDKDKPSVMVTIGHSLATETLNTVYISGQHDFYNDLIDIAGATNVYQSDTPRVPTLSLEGILALNPDVIIDIFPESDDHNANLEQVMSHWLSLSSFNAVKQHRVHLIEESYATIPGPRVSLLLEQFVNLIHPDIDWTDFPR